MKKIDDMRLLIQGEDPAQFELLHAQLVEQFVPRTMVERELVKHMAALLWRLRRALAFEARIIEARCAKITPKEVETKAERHWRQRQIIADRFRQAVSGDKPAEVQAEPKTIDIKKEPIDLSQLAQRKIGLALTKDSDLLHALGALARHEGALLKALARELQLLFSLRKHQAAKSHVKDTDHQKSAVAPLPSKFTRKRVTTGAVMIFDENPAQFESLCAGLEQAHAPQTRMQLELVNYAAGILWRLRRVPAFEASILEVHQAEIAPSDTGSIGGQDRLVEICAKFSPRLKLQLKHNRPKHKAAKTVAQPPDTIGLALIRDSQDGDAIGKLSRHETGLMNRLTRSLQLLFAVKMMGLRSPSQSCPTGT
jgi:hypothetical protein